MKSFLPLIYDKDKDTARARKHAGVMTYRISLVYQIILFAFALILDFPVWARLIFVLDFVISTILYANIKIPRRVYDYYFATSISALCVVYAIFSGIITVPLAVYVTGMCMIAMFRNERLIIYNMWLGMVLSVISLFITRGVDDMLNNPVNILEGLIIPFCIFMASISLVDLVKRDKQLFLFSLQKNRNNATLLQIVESKRDEAELAVKAKTEFLANTSHEIRTPMNSIMGMTELALREDISPQLRNYLDNIRDAGTSLLHIINDILDFSKIESGKAEFTLSDYSILSVINDICNIVSVRINSEAVQLVTHIEPDLPATLIGDERRIRQIILNLAINAAKYTRHGCITISVTSEKIEGGINLRCEVKDTGIGIKENELKRLFSAFERADTKRNKNIEGTGLGLAICKSLTEMMGGRISVKSVYGAGSIFTVEIPQKVKDSSPCIHVKDAEKKNILLCMREKEQLEAISSEITSLKIKYTAVQSLAGLSLGDINEYTDILIDHKEYSDCKDKLLPLKQKIAIITDATAKINHTDSVIKLYKPITVISLLSLFGSIDTFAENQARLRLRQFAAPEANILVVDDNKTNLLVAKQLISLYKPSVDTAESGIQALRMVQQKDYDIVFMDHMMPELDGIETTLAIRSLGEKYRKLVIVALTANVINGAAELFRESGMNDFLGKPIEMNELNRILSRYIPEEKQVVVEEEKEETAQMSDPNFASEFYSVDGLDVHFALKQCNGDITLLSDILRSVATSSSVPKMQFAFEGRDMRSYTIYVHGIKGALRNVGAESLGNAAYDLELAAKRGDFEYIKENHESFMDSFLVFSEKIMRIIEKMDDEPKNKDNLGTKTEELKTLISALSDMDYSLATRIIDEIRKHSYGDDSDKLLQSINTAINNFEFTEAGEMTKSILKKAEEAAVTV